MQMAPLQANGVHCVLLDVADVARWLEATDLIQLKLTACQACSVQHVNDVKYLMHCEFDNDRVCHCIGRSADTGKDGRDRRSFSKFSTLVALIVWT